MVCKNNKYFNCKQFFIKNNTNPFCFYNKSCHNDTIIDILAYIYDIKDLGIIFDHKNNGWSISKVKPESLGQAFTRPPDKAGKSTPMSKTVQKGRDARTGRFISIEEANRRPSTTVIEKVKVGPTKHHNN